MKSSLYRQLTRSHFLVTLISVIILLLGILASYFIYLQTDFAARWAGDSATAYADDIVYLFDGDLDADFIDFYIESNLPFVETAFAGDADFYDWLVVMDVNGQVIGSNYPELFGVGTAVSTQLFNDFSEQDISDAAAYGIGSYSNVNNFHLGQAPLVANSEHIGWVIYRGSKDDVASRLGQTAQLLTLASLAGSLISLLVAGLVSRVQAGRFSKRIETISHSANAFAAGNLNERITLSGNDEFTQLSTQFNQMADQLSTQLDDLQQLADKNAQLAENASALATLEERNRLARDLHDAIKQQLFGLNLTAGSIAPLVKSNPDLATERLSQLSTMTQSIHEEMDSIIKQLRPASLADKGVAEAIRALAAQWSTQTTIPVNVSLSAVRELPLATEQALLRVTQESLNNIARHAHASHVAIDLTYGIDTAVLTIKDDGKGFDVGGELSADSHGLSNMPQRMTAVGGTLNIESEISKGTMIKATAPIPLTN